MNADFLQRFLTALTTDLIEDLRKEESRHSRGGELEKAIDEAERKIRERLIKALLKADDPTRQIGISFMMLGLERQAVHLVATPYGINDERLGSLMDVVRGYRIETLAQENKPASPVALVEVSRDSDHYQALAKVVPDQFAGSALVSRKDLEYAVLRHIVERDRDY